MQTLLTNPELLKDAVTNKSTAGQVLHLDDVSKLAVEMAQARGKWLWLGWIAVGVAGVIQARGSGAPVTVPAAPERVPGLGKATEPGKVLGEPSAPTDRLVSASRSPAMVEELSGMMNQRPGVTARVATGDTLRYLDAMGAGRSEILLRPGASRWGAFHEWMHRRLQLRTGGPMPGEDVFIERFLERHQTLLKIQKPVGAP